MLRSAGALEKLTPMCSQWHLGCHKTAYLPTFRGFDSFMGYYEGSEDYWTHNFCALHSLLEPSVSRI